jgi:hypothetical protein
VADTIREQIISAYIDRLADWTTADGFNIGCGASVFRAVQHIDEADVPACVLIPQTEEVTQQYGQNHCEMILKVEAIAEISTTNPSVVQEQLLGDAIKIMTAPPYLSLVFKTAGYTSAVASDIGKTVTGAGTGDTGTLIRYNNTTRQWTVKPDASTDEFDASEAVTIADGTGAGTTDQAAEQVHVTPLLNSIGYAAGGPGAIPKREDTTVAVFAEFTIKYNTLAGDPYSQNP